MASGTAVPAEPQRDRRGSGQRTPRARSRSRWTRRARPCSRGQADGTLWGWDVATGALGSGASRRAAESREDSGTHPAFARPPRRRAAPKPIRRRSPRSARALRNRGIRPLVSRGVPRGGDGPWSPAASPGTFLVGAVGAQGVFGVGRRHRRGARLGRRRPGLVPRRPRVRRGRRQPRRHAPRRLACRTTTVDARCARDLRRGDDAAGLTGTGGGPGRRCGSRRSSRCATCTSPASPRCLDLLLGAGRRTPSLVLRRIRPRLCSWRRARRR